MLAQMLARFSRIRRRKGFTREPFRGVAGGLIRPSLHHHCNISCSRQIEEKDFGRLGGFECHLWLIRDRYPVAGVHFFAVQLAFSSG